MTDSTMAIRSIVPYYGGKGTMASTIVEELGPHASYFEPFCGGLSVLLAKPVSQQETVCDMNKRLTNLAKFLSHHAAGPQLYRELRRVPNSEQLYLESCEVLREASEDESYSMDGDVGQFPRHSNYDVAKAYFIASWMGRNGLVGSARQGRSFAVRYTPRGGSSSTRWQHAVRSIPDFRRRLRNVTILCRDAFAVIESIVDRAGIVIYCDPPYLTKSKPYIHDFSDADHKRLADALSRFKLSRVVVSYYDHPRLAELYPAWTKRVFVMHKNLSNQGQYASTGTKCSEVLLINGPSLAESLPLIEKEI